MKWASAISDLPDLDHALDAALDDAAQSLSRPADLAVVFVSGHGSRLAGVTHRVHDRLPCALLLGCSAGGVIGGGLEIEAHAGVSVTLASLPGIELVPFQFEGTLASASTLPRDSNAPMLVLADPYTVDGPDLVRGLDEAFPAATKIGGLASGGRAPGQHALFLGDATHASGAVGIALRGLSLETIVAQGCRPIGDAMFVTRHRGQMIFELNGKPAARVIRELYETLSADDRELFHHSLFLGVGVDDKREYRHGDFLIRNIGGVQRDTGALAAGATFEDYQVVQFHLRDARTSSEDLDTMLARHGAAPSGALLFSCLGRGEGLYGTPNHDSDAFHRALGDDVPLGGFFCNGEIGPVRGRTHLHGYTSCFGLFRAS